MVYIDGVLSTEQRQAVAETLNEIARVLIRQTAAAGAISLTAAGTLATLERLGPRRLTELAASEGVSQPSMTAMVSRLERQGEVIRQHDPTDGRIVLVAITDAGRDTIRQRRSLRLELLSELIDQLTPAEQTALAEATPALRHLTDAAATSPTPRPEAEPRPDVKPKPEAEPRPETTQRSSSSLGAS